MTREETKHRKTAIRSEVTRVRQMLNEWDPCLVAVSMSTIAWSMASSALHRGVTAPDLADWICQEFDGHFGVPVAREEALSVSSRILSWWSSSQAPRA